MHLLFTYFYPPLSGRYTGLETNARPRRVKFRPGEWFVRPDQPGGRVGIYGDLSTIIVIVSLALISSGLSRQNEILNRAGYLSKLRYKILCNDVLLACSVAL